MYHDEKDQKNIKAHGVSLAQADDIDWDTAVTRIDNRKNYGETRFITFATYRKQLHCLVWTVRDDNARYISVRKANAREMKIYEQKISKRNAH